MKTDIDIKKWMIDRKNHLKKMSIKNKHSDDNIEKIALKAMQWLGSVKSLVIHTILFIIATILYILGGGDTVLLIVTTIVSLEAIYLAIFIQMGVNIQSKKLQTVASNVEDLQKDVEEIQEDVEDIQEDVEEIAEVDEEDEDDEKLVEIQRTITKLIREVKYIKNQIQDDIDEEEEDDEDIKEIKNTLAELVKEVKDIKKQSKK